MKVVAQLVKHFWDRGACSLPEAAYLVDHGFVHERELAHYADRMKSAQCERPGHRSGAGRAVRGRGRAVEGD